jgi:hypothetical protein
VFTPSPPYLKPSRLYNAAFCLIGRRLPSQSIQPRGAQSIGHARIIPRNASIITNPLKFMIVDSKKMQQLSES